MKTVLRKSNQQCWPVGQPFAAGKTVVMYQRVQVRKTSTQRAFPPVRTMGYGPHEREKANREARPYPSLLHELTVRQDSIKEIKEKALAG